MWRCTVLFCVALLCTGALGGKDGKSMAGMRSNNKALSAQPVMANILATFDRPSSRAHGSSPVSCSEFDRAMFADFSKNNWAESLPKKISKQGVEVKYSSLSLNADEECGKSVPYKGKEMEVPVFFALGLYHSPAVVTESSSTSAFMFRRAVDGDAKKGYPGTFGYLHMAFDDEDAIYFANGLALRTLVDPKFANDGALLVEGLRKHYDGGDYGRQWPSHMQRVAHLNNMAHKAATEEHFHFMAMMLADRQVGEPTQAADGTALSAFREAIMRGMQFSFPAYVVGPGIDEAKEAVTTWSGQSQGFVMVTKAGVFVTHSGDGRSAQWEISHAGLEVISADGNLVPIGGGGAGAYPGRDAALGTISRPDAPAVGLVGYQVIEDGESRPRVAVAVRAEPHFLEVLAAYLGAMCADCSA